MRAKAALAFMMAAGMMSPQTMINPAGQTVQQQQIAESMSLSNPYKRRNRKGIIKTNGRLGRAFIVHNQRQKRKRWRQSPHTRLNK